jgi:hypothetical protein
MAYEKAVVLPLAVMAASWGVFQKSFLGLKYPSIEAPKATGKALLIFGGSTSVGCNAIQLAVAAGKLSQPRHLRASTTTVKGLALVKSLTTIARPSFKILLRRFRARRGLARFASAAQIYQVASWRLTRASIS